MSLITFKENTISKLAKRLFVFLNKSQNTNLSTQEKMRSSLQVYKIKDNTSKMNCFGHLPDNAGRQKMTLWKEEVCTIYIFKTRCRLLAPGGRTRCLQSQLPLQRTSQIQLMEKGNGTHQLENPTSQDLNLVSSSVIISNHLVHDLVQIEINNNNKIYFLHCSPIRYNTKNAKIQ